MNSLKLVTLDLDNTLWDVEKTIRAAEQELVQWLAQHAGAAHKIYLFKLIKMAGSSSISSQL